MYALAALRAVREVPFVDLRRQHAAMRAELQTAFDRVVASGRFVLDQEVDGARGRIRRSVRCAPLRRRVVGDGRADTGADRGRGGGGRPGHRPGTHLHRDSPRRPPRRRGPAVLRRGRGDRADRRQIRRRGVHQPHRRRGPRPPVRAGLRHGGGRAVRPAPRAAGHRGRRAGARGPLEGSPGGLVWKRGRLQLLSEQEPRRARRRRRDLHERR